MKKIKQAMNSLELKKMWDNYQSDYTKFLSKNFLPIHLNLYNLSKVDSNKIPKILDAGCGSGFGMKMVNSLIGKSHIIYGTDLSTKMLNYSFNNLESLQNTIVSLNLSKDIGPNLINLKKDNEYIENNSNSSILRLYEMNNEELKFESNCFDTVVSNFTLNIVNDPQRMVEESHRVLNENGTICCSIWGTPKNSLPFTIIPNALKKYNVPLPDVRSFFHLSNEEKLYELFSKFRKIYIGKTFVNLNMFSYLDFEFMLNSPIYEEIFKNNLDNEIKDKVKYEIRTILENVFLTNQFLNTEVLLIKAEK